VFLAAFVQRAHYTRCVPRVHLSIACGIRVWPGSLDTDYGMRSVLVSEPRTLQTVGAAEQGISIRVGTCDLAISRSPPYHGERFSQL